jgi:hypothetical protein
VANLQKAITEATTNLQTAITSAANESSNLSRKLNRLTLWIIAAAILSAIAAIIQAYAAIAAIRSLHLKHRLFPAGSYRSEG